MLAQLVQPFLLRLLDTNKKTNWQTSVYIEEDFHLSCLKCTSPTASVVITLALTSVEVTLGRGKVALIKLRFFLKNLNKRYKLFIVNQRKLSFLEEKS